MDRVFIKVEDLNKWVAKYFPGKDIISVDDLIGTIEDLDDDITNLKDKIKDFERDIEDNYVSRPNSYYTGNADDDRY